MVRAILITLLVAIVAVLSPARGATNFTVTADEVLAAVGERKFAVQCGDTGTAPVNAAQNAAYGRGVRVSLSKPGTGYRDFRVRNFILREAAQAVQYRCPAIFGTYAGSQQIAINDVGYAEIYGSLSGGPEVLLIRADRYFDRLGSWDQTKDVGAEQERREAAALAQQEQMAREQAARDAAAARARAAEEARQAAALRAAAEQAERAAAIAAENKRRQAAFQAFEQQLARYARWAIGLGLLVLAVRKRETLARWYYFIFYPHPAARLVRSAIAGDDLDPRALISALSESDEGGKIFCRVRGEQAERLSSRLQIATLKRLKKQESLRAQSEYEAASAKSIQEAVAQAAYALERAKALHHASQSIRRGG